MMADLTSEAPSTLNGFSPNEPRSVVNVATLENGFIDV
jgi:hypothetical protein